MTAGSALPQRIAKFALIGATAGVALAVVAASRFLPSLLFARSSKFPIGLVLALYPVAGTLGGVVVALAHSLTRWVGGSLLLGALALLPFYLGVALITDHHLVSEQLIMAAGCSVMLGGTVGAAAWFNEPRRSYRLAHFWLFAVACSALAWYAGLHWAGEWQAALAIPLFLIPVGLALMATFERLGS